jgi:hypothetical protein
VPQTLLDAVANVDGRGAVRELNRRTLETLAERLGLRDWDS